MTGEIDGIGTAIEGSALAAAVERERTGPIGADGDTHESLCLNCGTALIGSHCHGCGQKAHVHRTLSAVGHDLMHGVLHLEGPLWRTLGMLAIRPGQLTRRYIHGERKRFVSPMALFLFSVFLMFAVFAAIGSPFGSGDVQATAAQMAVARTAVMTEIDQVSGDLAANPDGPKAADQKRRLADLRRDLAALSVVNGKVPPRADQPATTATADLPMRANTSWPWFNRVIEKGASKAKSNPQLMLYKLQSNGYKFAWLLIPLSLPFMFLVTLGKRGVRFYDHAVFVTYSVSAMSLLFIICAILSKLGLSASWLFLIGSLIPPVHLYKQLRGAYPGSRIGAVLRLLVLLVSIHVIVILFVMALLLLGVLG